MHTIAAPMPTRDARRWFAVNWPAVLVFCLFVLTVEAILVIGWYRRQVALIPEPGRATPKAVLDAAEKADPEPKPDAKPFFPRPRETPETKP